MRGIDGDGDLAGETGSGAKSRTDRAGLVSADLEVDCFCGVA